MEILHSHHYRRPENYSEKNVMVIGGGPSGEDIAIDLVKHAKTVFWSHHASHQPLSTFPSEINMKPDVKNIKNESVVFVDDTEESIDTVIFCTGYKYHMPFLDESCKLEISTFRVYPLYRHIVNANEPTMFVFCLLKNVLVFRAMDLQARYSVKALVNGFKLPSKESMLKTINEQDKELLLLNRNRQKEYHTLRNRELSYYNEVAEEAGIESVKPSIVELLDVDIHKKFKDVLNYRRYVYTVIDDHTISIRLPEDEEETLILAGTTPRFIKGGGGC